MRVSFINRVLWSPDQIISGTGRFGHKGHLEQRVPSGDVLQN
jgi:hypothetical protein